jgi:hypothetical protein
VQHRFFALQQTSIDNLQMTERRQSPTERRLGRRAPFVAAVHQRVGARSELALAQNLGETGIQLKRVAGRAYLPRTRVALAFELPDGGGLVTVRGQVVFERAEGAYQATGVQFEALSAHDRARIARFLDERLS